MLQIILIIAALVEIAIYIFLGIRWWEEPLSLLFIVPLILCIVVVVRMVIVLPSYWLSGMLRLRDNNQQPWGNSLFALAKEIDARAVIFGLSQMAHQWLMPEPLVSKAAPVAPTAATTPVLLVHGYFSNRGIFWRLQKRIAAANVGPVYAVSLSPLLGSIDLMVPILAQKIEQICKQTNAEQVVIVAHSMGGLVTRRYLCGQNNSQRIKRFITIGSPHHGSQMAQFSFGTCVREMRVGSAWFTSLEQAEQDIASAPKPPTLSIYTLNDDLVYPPESSILDWAENIPMAAIGHVSMLFSQPVADRVIAEIKKADL